jgi:hypothetical protein
LTATRQNFFPPAPAPQTTRRDERRHHETLLVAIQVLDGIAPGICVVSVLVIADLARGTGRFNLTLGAITTALG